MAEWWENGIQLWCQIRASGPELQPLQDSKVEHARHRNWWISHPLIWCEPLHHHLLCPSNSSSEQKERERERELSTLSGFPMASRVIYSSSTAPSSSTPISSHTKLPKVSNFIQNANTLQPSSVFGKAMTISNSRVSLNSNPINKRRSSGLVRCSASSSAVPAALLFDCDGVLVDTERDGHRVSFNDAFTEVLSNPSDFFFLVSSMIGMFLWSML